HETVALHSHAWEHGATPPQASVELNVVGTTGPSGRSHEYQLAVDRLPSMPPTTYFYNKNLAEYATAVDSPNCRGGQHSWSATQPPFGPGMASATVAQVFGPTDPTQPDRLPGHLIGRQVFSVGSTYDGVTDSETITIAWDLQREMKPAAPHHNA
ncbi:MAG TPA: hypothetical protein VFK80_02665, partial [Limnochordia bacterium]|nr:hypothetical protein [Limnochordia bacterium]